MEANSLSVVEGLFVVQEDGPRLIGSRCSSCGTQYFPRAVSCRNPQCDEKKVERVLLSPQGTLYSYTIQRIRPPSLFQLEPWAPYAIGLVDLGQGLRVIGMLSERARDSIRIGMSLRLIVEPLYRRDDGVEVLTYKFDADDLAEAA